MVPPPGPSDRPGKVLTRWAAAAAALLAVGATAALTGSDSVYNLGWVLAVASVALLCAVLVVRGNSPEGSAWGAPVPLAWFSTFLVLALAGAAALFSARVVNTSFDDVFYVNRAVFVAERGVVPQRDTIYSNEVLPPLRGAGTVPVSSIETLQGAVGHVTGTHGAFITYLVSGPFVVALSVWVLWALVRAWSRGPAVLALMIGVAYQVWGLNVAPGASGSFAVSSLLLRAAWQGKVALIVVALPLAYLAITRWAVRRRGWDLVVLFAVGAAAVGLSSTALLLVPPLALAAAAAMAATRRPGWWGPLALAAYPVGTALVLRTGEAAGELGPLLRSAPAAYHGLFGTAGWGWLGTLGLLLGPWVARRGAAAVIAAAATAATVLVVAPFAPGLLADLSGAGPVVWRSGWLAPVPALLGVLAVGVVPWLRSSVPGEAPRSRVARVLLGAAVVLVPCLVLAAVVVAGRPMWSPVGAMTVATGPSWKFAPGPLDQARTIARQAPEGDVVLAPRATMSALALTTSGLHAVDPRPFFLPALEEDPVTHAARRRLSYAMVEDLPWVYRSFGADVARVGATLVCLDPTQAAATRSVERAGWPRDTTVRPPGLRCWRPSA